MNDGELRRGCAEHPMPPSSVLCRSSSVLSFFFLLDHLADEREDEERENRTPDKGVEDHQPPPEDTFGGGAESVGNGVAGLSEEAALEDQEQDEMHHAERNVCE